MADICILEKCKCKDCGSPIIHACCNGIFINFKDADKWDWWQYCSNKGCINHDGEGVFQNPLDWIEYETINEIPYKWIQESPDKPPYKVDVLA